MAYSRTDERRKRLYDWLGGLFVQPLSEEQIAAHLSGPGAAFLADLDQDPALRPALAAMVRALRAEQGKQSLGMAFSLLFLGAGGPATVPPYESAFTDPKGRLFQRATGLMIEELRRLDLSLSTKCAEPPDHLAVELMVMSHLIVQGDTTEQARFLERHLSWVSEFADLCGERDSSGFYAAAAELLTAFLQEERLFLNKAVSVTFEREIA
jgi:TorA-specific chaperone